MRPTDLPNQGEILFAVTHSAVGGLREIWNDVSEGLAARGHRVGRFVLYPAAPELAAPESDGPPWDTVFGRRPRSPLDMLRVLYALVAYLRARRPAAIVTAMPFANVLVPLAVTIARTSTRVYISHHSPTDTHNRAIDWLDDHSGRLACVRGIVSVSDAVAASLARKPARYRAKRLTIRNALPERIERLVDGFAASRDADARPGGRRIVALGRLTHQKNYPMLIRALAHIPGATLDIVGGGEDEGALRALAAVMGVTNRIRFLGHVSRDEALACAANADLFVQVSFFEGHSLALIEAARLGLALIVSDVPVQREGVTAADGILCGVVVPIGDDAALAHAATRLLDDPAALRDAAALARKLGRDASNRAMVDRYEALLMPHSLRPV